MTPLNNVIHKNLKVKPSQNYQRFNKQQLIPAIAQDFIQLATEFPVVFVKNSDTGQFLPVAMMGVKSGVNLYCQNELWDCSVKPFAFMKAPFSLVQETKDADEVVVYIDTESDLVSEDEGIALFHDDGSQTDFLNDKSKLLLDMAQFAELTQSITDLLVSKDLLTAKQLTVNLTEDSKPHIIEGIYLIDEQALNQLSVDEFQDIRSKGLLPLIYAHLGSIHQISRLTKKHNSLFPKK